MTKWLIFSLTPTFFIGFSLEADDEAGLAVTVSVPAQGSAPNLELSVRMEGDFADSSGNGYDGVASGEPRFDAGIVGAAASFDGVDDTVLFDSFPHELIGADDVTITLWIQLTVAQDRASILSKRPICNTGVFLDLRIDGFTWLSAAAGTGLGEELLVETQLAAGWNHVAWVREGEEIRLYLDGAEVDQDSSPVPFTLENDTPLGLSTSPCVGQDGTEVLGADLDELQIYSRALSEEEIACIRDGGLFQDSFESGNTGAWSQVVGVP